MDTNQFEGVFALLLTPFSSDGSIDWKCYDRYVEWQLSQQPDGLFAVCGSGEMHCLLLEERLELAKRAVQMAGNTPVLATANLNADLALHVAEMDRMAATGVAGLVLVVPAGMGKDHCQLEDYLGALTDQSPCPIFLYEWPHVQPCEIPPSVYRTLVSEHGVCGIKDTTCTLTHIQAKIEAAAESIVYQANTPLLMDAVELGARGTMAITSAAASDFVVDCWHAMADQREEAVPKHQNLVMLDAVLRFGYPATAKYLASLRGTPFDPVCRSSAVLNDEGAKAMSIWWAANQRAR